MRLALVAFSEILVVNGIELRSPDFNSNAGQMLDLYSTLSSNVQES